MPVFSTLGALTYTKLNNEPGNVANAGQFWYLQSNNDMNFYCANFTQSDSLFVSGSYPVSGNASTLFIKIKNNVNTNVYAPFVLFSSVDNPFFTRVGEFPYIQRDTGNSANVLITGSSNAFSGNLTSGYPGPVIRLNQNTVPNGTDYSSSFAINRGTSEILTVMNGANGGGSSGIWTISHGSNISSGSKRLVYNLSSNTRRTIVDLPATLTNNILANLHLTSTRENIVTYDKYFLKFANTFSGTPQRYAFLYQKQLNVTVGSDAKIVSDLDATGNTLCFVTTTGIYGAVYSANADLIFAKQISNANLTGIKVSGNDVYVCGTRNNNIYVATFDINGNNSWQNEFAGLNFNTYAIDNSDGLFVVGNTTTNKGFILKVPVTGNIPGNGNYLSVLGNLSYFASNATISNSTATISNSSLTQNGEVVSTQTFTYLNENMAIPYTLTIQT